MAKKVVAQVKLQIPAGKATPAPPVGTALGPAGVNLMDFCKTFNARTEAQAGSDHPGRGHGLRGPQLHLHHQDAARADPAAQGGGHREGLRRAEPQQGRQGDQEAGRGDRASTKMPDLNAASLEAAMRTVEGTARSMGIEVQG